MEFILRDWKEDDLESLVKYGNNYEVARFMADVFPHPYTMDAGKVFIAMANSQSPRHIRAIEIRGEAAGGIGIHPQQDIYKKNAELGYWLAEPFWGKGIITKAIKHMLHYGFLNFDVDRIYARPFGNNTRSQKALEKAGFVLEARLNKTIFKNGEYLDELIYSVRRVSISA
ncbi:MAG: GNAT family N-acetyltransferase [Flavisolibacter sp.]|nr:GNAT family N-acetyltransferase [Flavisolibacter sp.]